LRVQAVAVVVEEVEVEEAEALEAD